METVAKNTKFHFISKHNAEIDIDTSKKTVVISFDGKQSNNLYGKNFGTQCRQNEKEFYISADKVGIDYTDKDGNTVKNFLFSVGESYGDIYETLKPRKVERVSTAQSKGAKRIDSLKDFADSIDESTVGTMTKALNEMKAEIETLSAKIEIVKAVSGSTETKTMLYNIASERQKALEKVYAEIDKESAEINSIETLVSGLKDFTKAETLLSLYDFNFYTVDLRQRDDGSIVMGHTFNGDGLTAPSFVEIAKKCTAEMKCQKEREKRDLLLRMGKNPDETAPTKAKAKAKAKTK